MIDDIQTAKKTILIHAGHLQSDKVRSIIGSLRPFVGIYESDFRDMMLSLICLKESLSSKQVDREIICALWDFCVRLRWLSSTISNNKIITPEMNNTLVAWGECVDSFCRRCLYQLELEDCLSNFVEYLSSDLCPSPRVHERLLPLLESLKPNADFELAPMLEKAIRNITE